MKLNKKVYVILAMVLVLVIPINALAYSKASYKWANADPVKYFISTSVSSKSLTAISSATASWNTCYSNISLSRTYSSLGEVVNVYDGYYPSVSWDGLLLTNYTGTTINYQTMTINTAKTAYIDGGSALQSVVAHEFGHVFSLLDLPTGNYALMNGYTYGTGSRYGGYGIYKPVTDDINGVKSIY